MIIWLSSFPRSGNTFFRIVSHQIFGISTYTGFHSGNADLDRVGMGDVTGHETLPPELEQGLRDGDEKLWRPYHESDHIYLIKTHAHRKDLAGSELPTVLLTRDGRDVYVSVAWYWISVAHAWRAESPSRKAKLLVLAEKAAIAVGLKKVLFRRVLRTLAAGTRWTDFHASWLDEPHEKLYLLKFDDLVRDPIESCRQAFEAVGALKVDESGGELPDFEELHRKHPNFFRSGKRGDWREHFDEALLEQFWANHGEQMNRLGFER